MRLVVALITFLISSAAFALVGVDQCQDVNGHNVQIQTSTSLTQAAEGTILNGLPVILIHPGLMAQYSSDVQTFILAHECAHHRQGHVVSLFYNGTLPLTVEFDADCMAVRTLRDVGLLTAMSLGNIQGFLGTLLEDSTHPAGNYRAQYAFQCAR